MPSFIRTLAGLLFAFLLLHGSAALSSGIPPPNDSLLQTAVNGHYDGAHGTITLNQVESSRTRTGAAPAMVPALALTKAFGTIMGSSGTTVLATLVVHDGDGDGRRSHHLVRLGAPQFSQISNSITYSIELLNPASPPPARIDRAFVVFASMNLEAVTAPEPLPSAGGVLAGDLVEAVASESIRSGTFDPNTNQLRLRGVEYTFLARTRSLRASTFTLAELAPSIKEAYAFQTNKPVAVLAWMAGANSEQAVIRLEDFGYAAASDEATYASTVIEASAFLPAAFGAARLTILPAVSFGRFPNHAVCCNCNLRCSLAWTTSGYCKTCISPQGGDKCCSTCQVPADSDQACATDGGPALAAFGQRLVLGFIDPRGSRELLIQRSTDGSTFIDPIAVPNQKSNRGPGLATFGDVVVMGYKANDGGNNLWTTLSVDGANFGSANKVIGQESPDGPAVDAGFQNRVWMAYRANSRRNELFLTSSADGKKWDQVIRVPNQNTRAKPSMTVFQGRLVIAFLSNDTSNAIYVVSTTDLKTWNAITIPKQTTDEAPAVAVFNGRMYVAFKASDNNRIFVISTGDLDKFDGFMTVDGQTTPGPPALASFNGRLYLGYQAIDRSVFITSSADGKTFDKIVQPPG